MSKKIKWILIGVGILVVGLVVLSKAGVFGKDAGIKVTTEVVKKRTIIEIVNASGKVYPEVEVTIKPDISGEITELNIKEGDTVKKGQILAKIYADIYSIERDQAASGVTQSQAQAANSQASLDALKTQMGQAQRIYDMQRKLFNEKIISQNEFNAAEANLKTSTANYNAALQGIRGNAASVQSAIANLNKANKDLSRTSIMAPMDGVVSLLSVKKGERVVGSNMMEGTDILRIANMDKMEVQVDVQEGDIPKVKIGDSAIVEVDAYSNRKFRGVVTQIASSNNGAVATNAVAATTNDVTQYKVYIRLLPESYKDLLGKGTFPFRPGMSASADIQTKIHVNVLSVPISSVTAREKDDTTKSTEASTNITNSDNIEIVAFILQKDKTVKKIKVSTGIQDINNIEIIEGLKEGDEIITGPYEVTNKKLKDKDKVKVVDKKELFDTK